MSKIVVAIGGNALGNTPKEQKEIVKNTAKHLVDFIKQGNELVIVHGNGPQVGMINNGFSLANKVNSKSPIVDFPECGAMSQGYIGYHLQQAIMNELNQQKITKKVVSLITQTVVDKHDEGFKNPTKPIGAFYREEQMYELSEKNGWIMKEDAGRGWRQVIASPKPIGILEIENIKSLLADNSIVICAGGGGVPVIENDGLYQGVSAVIDKDFAAAKVAELIDADSFIILTNGDYVYLNFNKENQQELKKLPINLAELYLANNEFAEGSMRPKVEAAVNFVKLTYGKPAFIGSLDKVESVLKGKLGTKIIL